jgi:hypothetical protein
MAKCRMVNTHFWKDPYVRQLQAGDKLLFLYLLTNPSANIAGAYEIALDEVASDTGMAEKRVLEAFDRFSEAGKVLYKDHWILLKNFIKHQSKSEKVEKGIVDALKDSPDWVKDTLSIAYPYLSIYLILNLKSQNRKRKASFDARVVEVFEEWKTVLKKKSSLDTKRHTLLSDRLKDFSVEDLKLVPTGALKSEWHMGVNPHRKKYLEIAVLYRDNEQVEKFIELAKGETAIPVAIPPSVSQDELKKQFERQARTDRDYPQIG